MKTCPAAALIGLSEEMGSVAGGRGEQPGHMNTGKHHSKCQAVDANYEGVLEEV